MSLPLGNTLHILFRSDAPSFGSSTTLWSLSYLSHGIVVASNFLVSPTQGELLKRRYSLLVGNEWLFPTAYQPSTCFLVLIPYLPQELWVQVVCYDEPKLPDSGWAHEQGLDSQHCFLASVTGSVMGTWLNSIAITDLSRGSTLMNIWIGAWTIHSFIGSFNKIVGQNSPWSWHFIL